MTVELPEHIVSRLEAEANRRGVSIDVVVAELVAQLPAKRSAAQTGRLAFVGAGASASGITHRIDELLDGGFGRG